MKTDIALQHLLKEIKENKISFKDMIGSLNFNTKIIITGSDGSTIMTQNCTSYGGRRYILEKLFGKTADYTTKAKPLTLNHQLNIEDGYVPTTEELNNRLVCLVGVGTGGSKSTISDIYPPTSNDSNLYNIIPFRTLTTDTQLDGYCMKKAEYYTVGGPVYYNYYLKKIPSENITISVTLANDEYIANENDNKNVHNEESVLSLYNIQVVITITLDITDEDLKDYFRAKDGNINNARFNELALYFGIPPVENDPVYKDWHAVEAFSHLTFNNRPIDTVGSKYTFKYYLMS